MLWLSGAGNVGSLAVPGSSPGVWCLLTAVASASAKAATSVAVAMSPKWSTTTITRAPIVAGPALASVKLLAGRTSASAEREAGGQR